jgi:hypothetical protein
MEQRMEKQLHGVSLLRGLVGMAVGGALGYYAFSWAYMQGFYALSLPGALLGLGGGFASGRRSPVLAGIAALSAAVLGLYTEFHFRPFTVDGSLGYFLTHLHQLSTVTQVMLVLGVVFAAWFALGRERVTR